jgi:hypothetical protein
VVTTIYWSDPAATLHVGDARHVLAQMPDESADCIVTSPPYWGKRDYGVRGQYGHEPDPAGYVETLRAVFSEARRVLAGDGTCWLNLGDSYSVGGNAVSGMHAYLGASLAGHRAPACGPRTLPVSTCCSFDLAGGSMTAGQLSFQAACWLACSSWAAPCRAGS